MADSLWARVGVAASRRNTWPPVRIGFTEGAAQPPNDRQQPPVHKETLAQLVAFIPILITLS